MATDKTGYTVIFNPTSNRAKARRIYDPTRRGAENSSLDVEFVVSPSPEAVPEIALDVWKKGRIPVAMGGDGTVNMVARGLLVGDGAAYAESSGIRPVMGIIACGSGNDTAAALGLPVKRPDASVQILESGSRDAIDAVIVECDSGEEGVSLAVAAAGFDSEVTETAERIKVIKGPTRYTVAVFTTLVRSEPALFEMSLDGGDSTSFYAWLVAVANGPRYGGGMRIAPDASFTDGLADLCIVGPVTRRHFVRTFPRVFKGTHIRDPDIRIVRAKEVRLSASRPFACYGDGERIGPLPATFRVRPRAIEVVGLDLADQKGGGDGASE
jgi:diacylglycerol kinase (ATP)